MTSRTVFRNATVVTVDDELGNLNDTDVAVVDGRIAAIGRDLSIADAEEIDARGALLMPGFIDCHRHLWQTSVRAVFADWSTLQYMQGIRLHIAPLYTADDTYIATYMGAMECLSNGVTTVIGYEHNVNTPDHARAGIDGMRDAGVRGVYALGMGQAPLAPRVFSSTDDYRPLLRDLQQEYFSGGDELVRLGVAPVELFMAPLDVTADQLRLAREHGAQLTLHANAVQTGEGEIAKLHGAGLLGPDIVFVHGNTSSDLEYQLARDAGAAICAGVEVEIGMALGEPTLRKQREFGLHPTLGVDSVGCCGGSLIGQARLGMQTVALADALDALGRGENPAELSVTSREALRWATINGAKALGLESELGSITVGKRADLVLMTTSSPELAGYEEEEPEAAIISQSTVADIDLVMVEGRVVKRDGRLATSDWDARLATMNESKRRILGEARQPHGGLIPVPPPELPAGHGW